MTAADFLRPLAVATLALTVLYGVRLQPRLPPVSMSTGPVEPGYYRVQVVIPYFGLQSVGGRVSVPW